MGKNTQPLYVLQLAPYHVIEKPPRSRVSSTDVQPSSIR